MNYKSCCKNAIQYEYINFLQEKIYVIEGCGVKVEGKDLNLLDIEFCDKVALLRTTGLYRR
jgi:hypothetical protein